MLNIIIIRCLKVPHLKLIQTISYQKTILLKTHRLCSRSKHLQRFTRDMMAILRLLPLLKNLRASLSKTLQPIQSKNSWAKPQTQLSRAFQVLNFFKKTTYLSSNPRLLPKKQVLQNAFKKMRSKQLNNSKSKTKSSTI